MNRIFKVVWNEIRGSYMVCDENRVSRGKTKSVKAAVVTAAIVALCGVSGISVADTIVNEKVKVSYDGEKLVGAPLGNELEYSLDDGVIKIQATNQTTNGYGVLSNLYNDSSAPSTEHISASGINLADSNFDKNTSTNAGGALTLWNDGKENTETRKHTISNTTFSQNEAVKKGGALSLMNQNAFVVSGSANLTDVTFSGNNAKEEGGAIFVEKYNLKIDGNSTFTNNKAENGSAIFITENSNLTISEGVKFTENEGNGAIYITGNSNASVTEALFEGNTAQNYGAAIVTGTKAGELKVTDTTFKNNHAKYDGGAIGNYGALSITGSTFIGNTAQLTQDGEGNWTQAVEDDETPIGGGAIALGAVSETEVGTITNTKFINNKSGKNGGAIGTRLAKDANNSAAKLDIEATFEGNEAGQHGGAIYNTFYANNDLGKGDGVTVKGTFTGNQAGKNGGAIYNDGSTDQANNSGGVMTISDSTFTGNTAKAQGGAIYNGENAEITFRGTNTFSGNTASGEDNDIDNTGTITIASGTTTLNGGITTSRGTINVDDGATLNAENTTLSEGTLHVAGTMNVNTLKGEANSAITVGNGQSAGKLSVGNLQLNGGTLFLDPVWVDGTGIEGASQAGIESWENGIDGTLAIGRNSLAVLGEKTTDWTQAAFASTGRNWGEDDITAALAIRAPQTLTSTGEIRVDGTMTTAPASSSNSVTFDKNTMLIVDAAKIGDSAAITGDGSSTATIADNAALHIANAKNGQNVEILKDFSDIDITNGWQGDNLTTSDAMISLNVVEAEDDDSRRFTVGAAANRAEDVLPGVVTVNTMNTIWNDGQNDTAAQGGIGFLSRAADSQYLNRGDTVRTINGAAQMAVAAGVQLSNLQALDSVTEALENHISLTSNTRQTHAPRLHDEGADLWASMLYRHGHGDGMKSGSFHSDVNNNFGGIIVGSDYTWKLAGDTQIRAGAALSIGKGDSHSDGDYNYSKNDYDTYGINLYGSWNNQNVNIIADAGYMKGDNEVEQHLSQNLGGKLKADVDTEMWTAGIKGEYRIQTDAVDITPHLGVRYTHLKTDSFSSGNTLGTVFNTDSESYNIWQMPVGVTLSKDYKAENGWVVKPKFDFSVIGAAGDTEAETRVRVPGVNAADSAKADMMDSVSFKGVIGVEMQKDATSVGLSAGYQQSATMNSTGFMIQVGHHF